MPTVTFIMASWVTARNGQRKAFQAPMNVMMAKAVVMPQFIGKNILKKI